MNVNIRFLIVLTLIAAGSTGAASDSTSLVGLKGHANANASITASGEFVGVTWGVDSKAGGTDIYAAISRDGGRSFGAERRVNQAPGDASVSGEQPPRMALIPRAGREPSIVVVWAAKDSSGTRLLSARSDDMARSFLAPAVVPGSEAPGNRGWVSIGTASDGRVVAIWLDHRELASGTTPVRPTDHEGHEHAASGERRTESVDRAQLSKLMFGSLSGPDRSRTVAGGVCYCCKTAIATGVDGAVYATWRHVYSGNVRDVAFTRSGDGGRTFAAPVRVSEDQWVLDGCPENGPALTVDEGKRVHVVWPTLVPGTGSGSDPTLALFYAMSADGRRFTARQRIPTEGFPRHPQIALGSHGEIIVVWDEQAVGIRRIASARGNIDRQGAVHFVRRSIADAGFATYPVVASTTSGTIVAWTSGASGQTMIRAERLPE